HALILKNPIQIFLLEFCLTFAFTFAFTFSLHICPTFALINDYSPFFLFTTCFSSSFCIFSLVNNNNFFCLLQKKQAYMFLFPVHSILNLSCCHLVSRATEFSKNFKFTNCQVSYQEFFFYLS